VVKNYNLFFSNFKSIRFKGIKNFMVLMSKNKNKKRGLK